MHFFTQWFRSSLILVVFFFSSCYTPNYYFKQGNRMMMNQFYEDAMEQYIRALQRNPKMPEYRNALRNAATKVMDEKSNAFFLQKNMGQLREAVMTFRDMEALERRIAPFKVNVSIPSFYRTDYDEVREQYLSGLYQKATDEMNAGRMEQAQRLFRDIMQIDPQYRDAAELKRSAIIESYYQQAIRAMAEGHHRVAYAAFQEVSRLNKNYKDTPELMARALEKSIFTISLAPLQGNSAKDPAAIKLPSLVMAKISQSQDPFLKMIDRENLERMIAEQKLGMTGLLQESSAALAGKLLGIKALLSLNVMNIQTQNQPLRSVNRNAFQLVQVRYVDPITGESFLESQYQPVVYTEFAGSNQVNITYQFTLSSTETGEIFATDTRQLNGADQVRFATFQGNFRQLFPMDAAGQVVVSGSSVSQLRSLFESRQQLTPMEQVKQQVMDEAAAQVARSILQYHQRQL